MRNIFHILCNVISLLRLSCICDNNELAPYSSFFTFPNFHNAVNIIFVERCYQIITGAGDIKNQEPIKNQTQDDISQLKFSSVPSGKVPGHLQESVPDKDR